MKKLLISIAMTVLAVPVFAQNAARLMRRGLLSIHVEADRPGERHAADAHVGQPDVAVDVDPHEDMRPRRNLVAPPLQADPRAQRRDLEPQLAEHVQ